MAHTTGAPFAEGVDARRAGRSESANPDDRDAAELDPMRRNDGFNAPDGEDKRHAPAREPRR